MCVIAYNDTCFIVYKYTMKVWLARIFKKKYSREFGWKKVY